MAGFARRQPRGASTQRSRPDGSGRTLGAERQTLFPLGAKHCHHSVRTAADARPASIAHLGLDHWLTVHEGDRRRWTDLGAFATASAFTGHDRNPRTVEAPRRLFTRTGGRSRSHG